MELKKIKPIPKLPEVIINKLFNSIEKKDIKIGEELPPEFQMAKIFGVSRGSLRESLSILEFLGIVETQGNRKVVIGNSERIKKAISIVKISDKINIFNDLIELRKIIENSIVELACERAKSVDIKELDRVHNRLKQKPHDINTDYEFHLALANATHNVFLVKIEDLVICMLENLRNQFASANPVREKENIKEHGEILRAIKKKDSQLAMRKMKCHLQSIERLIMERKQAKGNK